MLSYTTVRETLRATVAIMSPSAPKERICLCLDVCPPSFSLVTQSLLIHCSSKRTRTEGKGDHQIYCHNIFLPYLTCFLSEEQGKWGLERRAEWPGRCACAINSLCLRIQGSPWQRRAIPSTAKIPAPVPRRVREVESGRGACCTSGCGCACAWPSPAAQPQPHPADATSRPGARAAADYKAGGGGGRLPMGRCAPPRPAAVGCRDTCRSVAASPRDRQCALWWYSPRWSRSQVRVRLARGKRHG